MPYADPEKQKAARAEWFRQEYAEKKSFRRAEAERKAAWQQTDEGREKNRLAVARWRAKQRKLKKGVKSTVAGVVGKGPTNGKSVVKAKAASASAGKGTSAGKTARMEKLAPGGKHRLGKPGKRKAPPAAKRPLRTLAKAA